MSRKQIGYRIWRTRPESGYSHLHIEVFSGEVLDAAKEYNDSPQQWLLDRLAEIRKACGSTRYFSCSDCAFCIVYQADRDNSCGERANSENQWYAPRFEDMRLNPESAALAAKLAKLTGWDPSPSSLLAILDKLGAKMVASDSKLPYSAWKMLDASYDQSLILGNPWAPESVGAA